MGFFGKLLALPVRILNVPFRAIEKVVALTDGQKDIPKEDRVASAPLGALADALEEVDGD